MIECWRNFFSYFTNAQLWGIAQRYRPIFKIPITDPDNPRESSPESLRKRRRIIRKWFIYAMQFMRIKKKLYQFIRQKRRDMKKIRKMKNRGGAVLNRSSSESGDETQNTFNGYAGQLANSGIHDASVFTFQSLLQPRVKQVPGVVSGSNLGELVKRYNANLRQTERASQPPPEEEPDDDEDEDGKGGSVRNPKWYMPCIIDLRVVNGDFTMDDEQGTEMRFEFTNSGLGAELRVDANTVNVGMTKIRGTIAEKG
jgi:hypothetical protein